MSLNPPITFLPTGAIVQRFLVAGHNIVLGYPSVEPYQEAPYIGETIGRCANRIKGGVVDNLNGRSYQLAQNNGPNTNHGGLEGWGKKIFSGPHHTTRNNKDAVNFTYISPDGEEGFPGEVELRVWYTVSTEVEDDVEKTILVIEYEAELIGDENNETVLNVTNHSYFNLSGEPTTEGTLCTLSTSKHLPVDDTSIPTGQITDHPIVKANTEFELGSTAPVIDHCFVVNEDVASIPLDSRPSPLNKLVSLSHPKSKIHLEVYSTEPAFQVYTGDYLNKENSNFEPRAGLCIEPGRFINAINVPEWKHQTLLKHGTLWGAKSIYKAWKA